MWFGILSNSFKNAAVEFHFQKHHKHHIPMTLNQEKHCKIYLYNIKQKIPNLIMYL